MNKILWILPQICFPPSDGGKQAVYYRIIEIAKYIDTYVVIINTGNNREYENEKSYLTFKNAIKNLLVIERYNVSLVNQRFSFKKISAIFNWIVAKKPRRAQVYESNKVKKIVTNYITEHNLDTVVFDFPFTAELVDFERLHNEKIKTICVSHNVESLYFKNVQNTCNLPVIINKMKFIMNYEKYKIFKYEYSTYHKADSIICLSTWDAAYIKENMADVNVQYLPCLLPEKTLEYNATNNSEYIVFPGSLTFYPNYHGVIWLLEKVFNKYLEIFPRIKFLVTGSVNQTLKEELFQYSGVELTGYLNEEAYEKLIVNCKFCVAPIFKGAGIKIKILEAMSYGLPLVTLNMSSQGIPISEVDEDSMPFMLAADEKGFLESMVRMTNSLEVRKKFSVNAIQFFNKNYNVRKNVFTWIESLGKR